MCRDLGLVNDRVHLLGSQCSVEKVLKHAEKHKAFLVVYDSAQKFSSDTSPGTPGSTSQCKAIGEAIKDYCGRTRTCSVVVNQMSGSGELKSGTELEHHCDTIMVLAYPKEDDEDKPREESVRVLQGTKNRVGLENQRSYFIMSDAGRLEHVPARSKLVTESRRKYSRGN
jgi:DNA repair protein RadA/Sms